MFERNEQDINAIIEENLKAVLSGETSIDEVVLLYPEHEKTLRGELGAALWLFSRRDQVSPRPGFLNSSKKRVLARIKEEARGREGKHAVLSLNLPRQRLVFRWAAVLVVLVMLVSGFGGVVAFSQDALPGQEFYGFKRAGETISYNLASGNLRKVELNILFTDRRLQELEALAAVGDMTQVESTLQEYNWEVNQAVVRLQAVSNSESTEKRILAQVLSENLAEKAERLDILASSVPLDLQGKLADARDRTLHGAFSAMSVLEGMDGQHRITPTPTLTPTPLLTSTSTATFVPTQTLVPPVIQEESEGVSPDLEEDDDGKKPSVTPRPTNPNRPTKQPDPSQKDKPPKNDKASGNSKDK